MQQNDCPLDLWSVERAIDRHPLTVAPETPVLEAIALMSQGRGTPSGIQTHSSCLAIAGSQLMGIFTRGDAVGLMAAGIPLEGLTLGDVMSDRLIALKMNECPDIFRVLDIFREHQISHLPAIDDRKGELLGLVTQKTLLQVLDPMEMSGFIDRLQYKVTELETEKVSLLRSRNARGDRAVAKPAPQAEPERSPRKPQQRATVIFRKREKSDPYKVKTQIDNTSAICENHNRHNQHLEALVQERTAELARTVERLQIEIARRQQRERQFSAIAANLPGVVYRAIVRADGRMTIPFISNGIQEFLGIDPIEAMADLPGLFDRVHPDDKPAFIDRMEALKANQRPLDHQEFRIVTASGEIEWVQDCTHYTRMENGDAIADGAILNITARKQAEEAMRQQVERERLMGAIAQRIRKSLDLTVILSTTVAEVQQVLGCDRVLVYRVWPNGSGSAIAEAVEPGWLKVLHQVFPEEVFPKENYRRYIEGRICTVADRDSGDLVPCLVEFLQSIQVRAKLVVPIVQKDTLWGLLIAHHCSGPRPWQAWEIDLLSSLATQLAIAIQQSELYEQLQVELSDRKTAQAQIKASLEEKELLLKEVHHRVKNNLQVISSIFSIQASYLEEPKILSILADSQNRIASMALIHEKLYQSENLAKIDFTDYIENLVTNLFSCYNINSNRIHLDLHVEDVSLNLDAAIPCGLLLNELVSNSLKHAFLHQNSGSIGIKFCVNSEGLLSLSVRDSGQGLPAGLDVKKTNSLGLRLVRALTRQLRGTLQIETTPQGACFQITFPPPENREVF